MSSEIHAIAILPYVLGCKRSDEKTVLQTGWRLLYQEAVFTTRTHVEAAARLGMSDRSIWANFRNLEGEAPAIALIDLMRTALRWNEANILVTMARMLVLEALIGRTAKQAGRLLGMKKNAVEQNLHRIVEREAQIKPEEPKLSNLIQFPTKNGCPVCGASNCRAEAFTVKHDPRPTAS